MDAMACSLCELPHQERGGGLLPYLMQSARRSATIGGSKMRIALAVAAAALACGMSIPGEADLADSLLRAARVPGTEAFPVERLWSKIIIRQDRFPHDRNFVLKRLFDDITEGAADDTDAVVRVGAWVQRYFVHPMYTPLRADGNGVYDPVQLLRLRRAQCGQVNRVMLDILAAGGYRGRVVQLNAHQGAEVFYGGAWHYVEADALDRGRQFRDESGNIPSAETIFKKPSIVDGTCYSCETIRLYNQMSDDEWTEYKRSNPYYSEGGRWRMVFSLAPEYYEKVGGTSDPEYGWMDYRTYR
jgi:hypothetical protein